MPETTIRATNRKTIRQLDGGCHISFPTGIRISRGCETAAYAVAAHIAEYVCPAIDITAQSWEAGCELELQGPVVKATEDPLKMASLIDYAYCVSSGALEIGARDGSPKRALVLLDECARSNSQQIGSVQVPTLRERIPEEAYSEYVSRCFGVMGLAREGFIVAPTPGGFHAMGPFELASRSRLLEVSCSSRLGVHAKVRLAMPSEKGEGAIRLALRVASVARRNAGWDLLKVDMLDAEARLSMARPVPVEPGCISGFLERSDTFLSRHESTIGHLLGLEQ